jgi:hypothetical protein
MEPLAIAGYLLVATAVVDAVIVGAFAGAIGRAVSGSLLWVGLLVAGGYLAGTVLLASYSLAAAAVFGLPPLVLTFLISWLTACCLEARARLRRIWTTLVAICCALTAGLMCGLLFRLGMWAPVIFAVAADGFLIIFLVFLTRRRKPVWQ